MSEQNFSNNDVNGTGTSCEGAVSSRPVAEQRRHSATAKKRIKWSKIDNESLFKCFCMSEPNRRNYRRRLNDIWKSRIEVHEELRNVSEQRLCDQVKQGQKVGLRTQR